MHPIHLSVTNFEINKFQNSIFFSVKLYIDDFQNALSQTTGKKIDLINDTCLDCNSESFTKYLQNHFKISIGNNSPVSSKMNYTKAARNKESIWLYYEISDFEFDSLMVINNTLMFDIFDDQTNLTIVTLNDISRGFQTTYHDHDIIVLEDEYIKE